MQHRYRAIIFDFDYTLADSSRGVVECVNHALSELGLPTATAEAIHRTIGLSLTDTLLELAGVEHATQGDDFVRLFVKRADEVMADSTVVFESVPRTIEMLKEHGFGLGIVSTKFRYRIEAVLGRENLLSSFDVIVGGEDVTVHKPDPTGLLTAMEKLGSQRSVSLYMGDSVVDAHTAQRAGVPFVAVLSGVTPKEDFAGYAALGILDDVSELPSLLGC